MSAEQRLVLTALPHGVAKNGQLRLSVLVTPRLAGAATLAAFPDMLDWTGRLRQHGLELTIAVAGGATAQVTAATSTLRPDLWKAIFKADTRVDPYPRPDFADRLIVSYPHRTAHQFLRWGYVATGTRMIAREGGVLRAVLDDLAFRDANGSTLDAALTACRLAMWGAQKKAQAPPPPIIKIALPADGRVQQPADTRVMAEQVALFHRMPPAPGRPPLPSTPAGFAQVLDFHKAVSALAAYPALMRALGLVLEVELPASLVPEAQVGTSGAATLTVGSVTPGWAWSLAPQVGTPATAVVRDAARFQAAPAASDAAAASGLRQPGDVVDGFLALGADAFELVNIETDGAMLKALSLADNVALAASDRIEQVLPALRSGGLSLVADARAQEVLRAVADNSAFQAAEDTGVAYPRPLDARDLTRGYRIDIWSSQDGRWHSLHRRDGTYRFGSAGTLTFSTSDEEGFTQLGVAQPADDPTRPPDQASIDAGAPQPGTDLYVHERIARWHGWSLSAPRPGVPLNRSADPARAAEPDDTADEMPTPFKMKASFGARAGSLPRLRFGARYRFRVRAVDLAGNSSPLGADAPDGSVLPATGAAPYFRFEPVPPPVIVPRAPPENGAELLNLAIRSFNSSPALDHTACGAVDERHLVPPKADVLSVEHHGMLDDAAGKVRSDQGTYDLIVARDRGAFPEANGSPVAPADQAEPPWFPDPLARGAALAGLPGAPDNTQGAIRAGALVYDTVPGVEPRPGSVTLIPFDGAWPDRRAIRLILAEGRAPPVWDPDARTLTAFLRKAAVVQVPVSSYLLPPDLPLMGVWDWMRQEFEAQEALAMQAGGDAVVNAADHRGRLTRLALEGGHELITPAHTVTLTHAVQQPIGRPGWVLLPVTHDPAHPQVTAALRNRFSPVSAWRSRGSHHAVLLGALRIHAASTAKVDILARWTELVDDPAKPGPTAAPAGDHVETIELRSLAGGLLAADGNVSRYLASYIPHVDTLWFAGPADTLPGVPPPGEVAAPVHQFGDSLHRRVRYRAVSTSRFQEYFPEPGLSFTRESDEITVSVPSSARPAAPDILYCVPLFGWERQETTNVKTEVRRGNGLRIYLNRPWYSSGEGELLGVTLWQAGGGPSDADRSKYRTFFSQWGLDPVWAAGEQLAAFPVEWMFPEATALGQALTLEATDLLVDVAGHRVDYDPVRRLWFCDILFDVGDVYAPIVRLALARYQPASIAGVELSHVVLADFAQLTPDRSAALTVDPADPTRGRLFVGGIAPSGPTRNLITVTVEKRDPAIGGDLGWVQAGYAEARAVEDAPAPDAPDAALWMGGIVVASPPEAGRFRIVVREFELYPADQPLPDELIFIPIHGERLIYASIIPWDFVAA